MPDTLIFLHQPTLQTDMMTVYFVDLPDAFKVSGILYFVDLPRFEAVSRLERKI